MILYHVHIYREMRLYFPGIDAASHEEAARIAADKPTADAEYVEDCDGQNLAALVDVAGDDDFGRSVTIDFEAERLRKAAPDLLKALDHLRFMVSVTKCTEPVRAALEKARAAIARVSARSSGSKAAITLTNQQRAARCQKSIASYPNDDTYTNLVDFLADVLHLCQQSGHSFQAALDSARMHFTTELLGDGIFIKPR
jgi:hypothetical protein